MSAVLCEARKTPDGRWIVTENMAWLAEFTNEESARAYALARMEWLAAEPDPSLMAPFFRDAFAFDVVDLSKHEQRLWHVLEAMLAPERLYA